MIKPGRIVCFGELLIRLSAPARGVLLQTPHLDIAYGGAEANVAVSLATLGHDVAMVSAVPDNPLGRAAQGELRRHNVDARNVLTAPGRMGLYFLSPGAGHRAPEVTYDRVGSSFAAFDFAKADWGGLLDGAVLLHVSGISAALGRNSADGVIKAISEARARGVIVSFDCNYREKLWNAWKGDAPAVLREIIAQADLLFGDHRDVGLVLGKPIGSPKGAAEAAFAAFPNLQRLTHTVRTERSASHHDIAAATHTRAGSIEAPAISCTDIVDRVGAGDAFAAGVLHGLSRAWDDASTLRFALAAAALKHAIPGDFNLAREDEVQAVADGGGAGIRR
jgi:2-dehydro-3-deoxygluconokinase